MDASTETRKRLEEDIEILLDKKLGYVRAGLPRFPALFGRDSCIVSWQLLDYDPAIAEKTLSLLGHLQGKEVHRMREEEPGKIPHEWHPDPAAYKPLPWPLPYYGSVDATPLFVWLSWLYYEKTVDTEWLTRHWPHVEQALAWCASAGDPDGDLFLEYERKNPSGLFHQGWKDSTRDHLRLTPPVKIVEVQGYLYAALRAGSECATTLKKLELAADLGRRAALLKERFLEAFWLPGKRYFGFARTPQELDERVTSNPGHLLFTGILEGETEKIAAVVERLFASDMWTPYGIRTHSALEHDFDPTSYHLGSVWPHDNWITAEGMRRNGYDAEHGKVKKALRSAHEAFGKIPELYAVSDGRLEEIPVACAPQAWSSGALLNFLTEKS